MDQYIIDNRQANFCQNLNFKITGKSKCTLVFINSMFMLSNNWF